MATPPTGLPADQLHLALSQLVDTPPAIASAIYTLNLLGYTTPAADLQSVLDGLNSVIAAAQAAIASGTTG